jgi:hypothetical protein
VHLLVPRRVLTSVDASVSVGRSTALTSGCPCTPPRSSTIRSGRTA